MEKSLEEILGIRYTKINFTIRLVEDTVLPEQKASALRGGIGEMLLRVNCIRDRNCEVCDFESECIVRRTMYSKFERKPDFVTTGDSVGYVMECEDYRTTFYAGDCLKFTLILFGKTIVYFSQYMQAIFSLGQLGVGKNKSKFQIVQVTNQKNENLLLGDNIYMERYEVSTIRDYVIYRKRKIEERGVDGKMTFRTPLTLKNNGVFIDAFEMEAILKGVVRRIFILDCFEGIEADQIEVDKLKIPEILNQRVCFAHVKRYSNRQKMSMQFHGIKGEVNLISIEKNVLEILLAGELIHIGKNTSFGFGKYILR